MRKIIFVVLSYVLGNAAWAYVACDNVDVSIQTATGSSFHNFNEVGVVGSLVFVGVPGSQCKAMSGETLSSNIYLVLDDIENVSGLKQIWVSMLLSAEAREAKVVFHASSLGTNSRGFQVLKPYYLRVK